MTKKVRVGVLFGGRSAEHEVSLQSARSIIDAIDREKFDVVPIGISKQGQWFVKDASQLLVNADRLVKLNGTVDSVAIVPSAGGSQLVNLTSSEKQAAIDVVFPVLHGTYGEDGTIQGLLKLADVPFVGPGVLGSAVGMDKDVAKRLMRDAGIPVARFLVYTRRQQADISWARLSSELGTPLFVKPANLGSSVGVSKVRSEAELKDAVAEAFSFDSKILVEEAIDGREIECAVLGNDDPVASVPGEVVPQHDFYSYEAKYIDENGAILLIPANLSVEESDRVRELAIRTFKTLCCEGMARVDFFLDRQGKLFVNEINTIPGFTKISMYPKLFEASGIPYRELVTRLIGLAIERFERERSLKTTRDG